MKFTLYFLQIRILIFVWAINSPLHAQWATKVVDYQFGTSQTVGQDPAFFPANVLGPVANSVGPRTPAASPKDVCSIGKGGFITFQFERDVIDLPGPDFTVFENAFSYGANQVFDEWIIVSVSSDGVEWHTFPFDSVTGSGFAGRTPTAATGSNHFDPTTSGGDAFDLETISLQRIKYIRLTDATHFQSPDRLSAEVDAVLALHLVTGFNEPSLSATQPTVYYLPIQHQLIVDPTLQSTELLLLNAVGSAVFQAINVNANAYQLPVLPSGVYVACLYQSNGRLIYNRKLIIGE
jgi:hypothetical protein